MNTYNITVQFPSPYSSNDYEVAWYSIEAKNEKQAFKKARKKASERIRVIVTNVNGGPRTDQCFD
jgi:hypothetical protein|tara:strand:- start:1130 stop:1324 length:195 start_codon:yes stop_codon:yes gene_type:complete